MTKNLKRVLLVDDEVEFSSVLLTALRTLGYETQHWTDLPEFSPKVLQEMASFPIVLMDRGLPSGDGIGFVSKLRSHGYPGSILMITAQGEIGARVEGLDAGADDYLPKPFSLSELEARLRALQRRMVTMPLFEAKAPEVWSLREKDLQVLLPRGQWVTLTPLEFKLLSYFLKRPLQLVTRRDLLKEVWGFQDGVSTRTIDFFMGQLRQKIESPQNPPRYLVTHRGRGFEFVL